jgi:hypothetical protein
MGDRVNDETWTCARCGATNETWRNWCRSCSMTQGDSAPPVSSPPPFAATPSPFAASPPPDSKRSGPTPLVIVAAVLAVVVIGVGAFVVFGSGGTTRSAQATVDAAILHTADLPDGFVESDSSSSSSSSDDPAKQAANACFQTATGLSPDAADKDRTAKRDATFKSGSSDDKVTINASAEVYGNLDTVTKSLRALSDPAAEACVQQLFTDTFAKTNVTVSDYQQLPVELPKIGDDRNGFRVEFTITGPTGKTAQLGFVSAVVKVGHAFVSMVVTSLNGAEPPTLVSDGLTTMTGRLG